jgi:formate--tetrahydrofolate ligase
MNDRALRQVVTGLGAGNGVVREGRWVIVPASEVMAIVALAADLPDLQARLARIIVGSRGDASRAPIRAADLGAADAMALLLREALAPNLVQTLEGGPALVHAGPFGNLAHGCNRLGGLSPAAAVLVATVRSLKMHGGVPLAALDREDTGALERGLPHLAHHVANVRQHGVPVVVAINRRASDTDAEVRMVADACAALGVPVAPTTVFAEGGAGGEALAREVLALLAGPPAAFRPLYDATRPIAEKAEVIARRVYGADGVDFTPAAARQAAWLEAHGMGDTPVCMAKTQSSFTDDPTRLGVPTGFRLTVTEVTGAAGAGFVVARCGDIMTMPGLGAVPAATRMRLAADGTAEGLS